MPHLGDHWRFLAEPCWSDIRQADLLAAAPGIREGDLLVAPLKILWSSQALQHFSAIVLAETCQFVKR